MATEPTTKPEDRTFTWEDLKRVLKLTATLVNLKLYSHSTSLNWEVRLK